MPKSAKSLNPKSVLDKIVFAIRSSPPGETGGVSRASVTKYLKSEFNYENATQIKMAFKKGVSNGVLAQNGQSFTVAKDPPRAVAAKGEPYSKRILRLGKARERSEEIMLQSNTLED